ncbi:MAG: histidinol-phosphatase [Planctomycetes bacterium RBG_13_63_9]|nr:MAG: histidinol-phosphatase [Planctomycetes bacterium RBG_13_63_9]
MSTTERLELAIEVARGAGRITLEYFRRDDLQIERKGDDSPVTVADRRAEEHLRRQITDAFPEDAIVGEEMPEKPGTSGYCWILDPIDGTKSFIHGVPLYGTLVGVVCEDEPVVGVILIPALGECVYAATGQGAWYVEADRPPRPARVSDCPTLAEGLFLTSELATFDEVGRRDVYRRLEDTARLSRVWGDCYGYLMVATGRAELMVDPVVAVWDVAAVLPVIEEAGGTFTDWQGRRTIHSGQSIATNGRILDEVLSITREPS